MEQMKNPLINKPASHFINAVTNSAMINADASKRPAAAVMIESRINLARR
jgi:hypothetical protein